MKKLILSSLFLISCNPAPVPVPNGDITVTQVVGGNNPSGPSTPSACLPVDRVRIVSFPSVLAVNTSEAIDVTPRDQFGNIRSDSCNEASGNRWTSNDSICTVPQPNDFRSNVRGVSVGTCQLTACVTGHCDTVQFQVQ